MIDRRGLHKALQMTENVAAFIAVFAAIVWVAGIRRVPVRVVRLLRYLFARQPVGERTRAYAPAQGVEQEDDENGNDEFLNRDSHGGHYTILDQGWPADGSLNPSDKYDN